MKVGDLVRVTMEFGKYWHRGQDIAGMTGIILKLRSDDNTAELLMSCGSIWPLMGAHAWLEVINESR